MAYIKSRKHAVSASAAAALALTLPVAAEAQQATPPAAAPAPANRSATLPEVRVQGSGESDYKVDRPASPKYTAPLLDTPQTITVVPARVLEQQNRVSLTESLANVPGITFGAGEGGGGYGDNITFRGYSATNNITTDGMRDSALYNRTDGFNLEQIEVTSGANSVYGGAGNVSGGINLVSKTPKAENFGRIGAAVGTDRYLRATADVNRLLGDTTALRLNLMGHRNDVPGRDVEQYERYGIAPSLALGLNTPTTVTLSYLHQRDDNVPQYGVPYYANQGGLLPGADRHAYYGFRNIDEQKIDVDMFTATIDHRFSPTMKLRNMTRLQKVSQYTQVNALQGTWCMASGTLPDGSPCTVTVDGAPVDVPPGFWLKNSGPRGSVRDFSNTLLGNQTDLTTEFKTGSLEHTLVAGLALTHERYRLRTSSLFNAEDGTSLNGDLPLVDISDPDNVYDGPINKLTTGRTRGELDSVAAYVFDTMKLNEQWQVSGGLRFERYSGSTHASTIAAGAPEVWGDPADSKENLFSYRLGVVFKPAPNGSVYLAFGNSETPSKASVTGSCTNNSTTGANNCSVDPEEARTIELGTKWDVLDNRLSLTAAIFRNELTNYRVTSLEPGVPDQVLDGKSRVDGVALGIAGSVTSAWDVFANYTYLDSKVKQGASRFCRANPGTAGCDAQLASTGNSLTNVPKHAFSLWTTYRVLPQLTLGYGALYQGSWYLNNQLPPLYKADAYWVHNAMAAWRVSRNLELQLNVKNLFDEEYYTHVRNNGWARPGDERSAVVSALYSF